MKIKDSNNIQIIIIIIIIYIWEEKDLGGLGGERYTLFLEGIVALEAGTEAINGLASLSNPKSHCVYCPS